VKPITTSLPRLIDGLWARLDDYASLDKLEGFSLRDMFSEVLKQRTPDEVDDYFVVGSYRTTPKLEDVSTAWPKPWFFARVLTFIVILYIGQILALRQFNNPLVLPGLMMTGSLAMPLAIAFLFFELNVPRNISFHRVLMLACAGGVLSILISLVGFDMSKLHTVFGAPAAGIIEESGKLLAVLIMTKKTDKRFILNGCLFGAAVGAGFAAFESAGYAFLALFQQVGDGLNVDGMVNSILQRGVLAPFGHGPWTAITAGALWRASVRYESNWDALADRGFLRTLAVTMSLHALWNLSASLGGIITTAGFVIVGVSTWYVVFGIIQQGLKQVRAAQALTTTVSKRAQDGTAGPALA
jgi:RsiW-degrading membrane proteinase PrsW (M82 family)